MTQNETLPHFSLAAVHYAIPGTLAAHCGASGTDTVKSPLWAAVTCAACRLEQPANTVETPGRVEYRVPENVKATDRALGEQDKREREAEMLLLAAAEARKFEAEQEDRRRLETCLAAVEATYRTLSENIEYLKERRAEARAEREDLVRRLSVPLVAQKAPGVAQVGSAVSSPQNCSQGAPARYRVVQGYGRGRRGSFVGWDKAYGASPAPLWIMLDGETVERSYSPRCLERIS